jgi:hypothetical protein
MPLGTETGEYGSGLGGDRASAAGLALAEAPVSGERPGH